MDLAKAARTRRKQAKPQRKNVETDDDDAEGVSVTTESSLPEDVTMSPDSNDNLQIKSNCRPKAKSKDSEENVDDEKEGSLILVEKRKVNGLLHLDDAFTIDYPDYDMADTPSSDLVIDERSIGSQSIERSDSPVSVDGPKSVEEFEHDQENFVPLVGVGNSSVFKENDVGAPSPADISAAESADSTEFTVKCPQCYKMFGGYDSLKEHIQLCHPERSVGYSCLQCNAAFSNRDQLDKHELLHSPNAQVSCKVCNKTFANVYRLQRHMISHDESAVLRKFKCPQCEKAFKFKHHLKEHIRIHSGEKPFECSNCGKRFSHSGSYSSHMTSKKCLIMNLKVNHRNRGTTAELKTAQSTASYSVSRNSPSKTKAIALNNNNKNTANHNTHNNNNIVIRPMSKCAEQQILMPPGYGNPVPNNIHPFFFPPNLPYPFPSSINHLIEQLTGPYAHKMNGEKMTNGDATPIKKEIKEEEDDYKLSPMSRSPARTPCEMETAKRMLETANDPVQQVVAPKPSSSCSSECASEVSSHQEEQIDIYCRRCGKYARSVTEMQHHERYVCRKAAEGLAAKLEDALYPKENGRRLSSACNSDSDDDVQGSGREYIMTEDEDSESVVDGRKVRVRSQIAEEQLLVLKQYYSLNPRPKREELEKISRQVGFPIRVVQVWFQNNRARDRREGRLVHIPYAPIYPPYAVHAAERFASEPDQPLDLSTKKIVSESDCGAVNLSRRSPARHSPVMQQNGFSIYARSSPVTSSSPIYNGSCSPTNSSDSRHSWRQDCGNSSEGHDFQKEELKRKIDDSPTKQPDNQTSVQPPTKKSKLNNGSAATDTDTEGQRPHKCEICSKAFKHKHHLTEHKRLHSGEKPFQCCKCFKRFSHSGSYSQHMNHRYSYCKPYRD